MLSKGNLEILQKPSVPKQEHASTQTKSAEASEAGAESRNGLVKKIEAIQKPEKTLDELTAALDTAREDLARKKGELKEFEALFTGTFKGMMHGERKANVRKEYDDFLKKYQEARADYVVGDVSRLTEERMKLAEALVEAKGEGKEHFLYKGYKWLGEQNVAKLFGEKFGWKLSDEFQKDHPLASASLRIAGQFLSVRTAISMGLLGAGLMAGVGSGLAMGMGIVTGRAFMRGIGTAVGSHDILKAIGATAWESKGGVKFKKEAPWHQKISLWEKLTPEEIGKLPKKDIEDRLANMEAHALLHGKKVGESDVYKQLLSEYENKLKHETYEKGETAVTVMRELSEAADAKRDKLAHDKRIKHQTLVGVLTAAMVVLPGIHQFQRVIEKNAAEWAAVTKGTYELVTGQPAYGAELHKIAPHDTQMMADLKDKTVKFALETDAHARPDHQLSIEDLRHIRNIASRTTEDGRQMKSLLVYVEKKNLIEQSGIKTISLEGNHTTVYGALQEAASQHPDYFKGASIDQRALEIAKLHGVTVEQLKILPHAGEQLYISKEGVIITQEKMLVGQTGDVSRAHEISAGARSHAGGVGTAEHAPRTVHPARGAEDLRRAPQDAPPRRVTVDVTSEQPRAGARAETGAAPAEAQSKTVKIEVGSRQPGGVQPETAARGEIVIEQKSPATGSITQERINIQGADVKTEVSVQGATASGAVVDTQPHLAVRVEPAGQGAATAGETPRMSAGETPVGGATHEAAPGVKMPEAPRVPAAEAPRVSAAEVFARGYDSTHAAEFAAAARTNPNEFLKFYNERIPGGAQKAFGITHEEIRSAITDPFAGERNIQNLMRLSVDAKKPFGFSLYIDGNTKSFNIGNNNEVRVFVTKETRPSPGTVLEETLEEDPRRLSGDVTHEAAVEQAPRGKIPVNMDNFYGGKVTGSVQFDYDAKGNPIGYRTNANMLGVGIGGDLENKFLFSGWGYDKSTKISEILLEKKSRVNTTLLRETLRQLNRQLAFDTRLYADLTAGDHKPEAELVLKGAKKILARVHEYGMDDQLINTANLPPELR